MGSMIFSLIITGLVIAMIATTLYDDFNHNYLNIGVLGGLFGMASIMCYVGGFIYG